MKKNNKYPDDESWNLNFSNEIKENGISDALKNRFINIIYDSYENNPRPFPWRDIDDPYKIFISEFMLQQTQAERVVPKFLAFTEKFPNFHVLSEAKLEDVIGLWQGLGYNRRAMWLKQAADLIVENYGGILPKDPEILESFKGIGHATAREMAIFSYNEKFYPFIETNIRRLYIHFFFRDQSEVDDKNIMELVEKTADQTSPRKWGYAIMDYGVFLKKKFPKDNPNKRGKAYKKQSQFLGSNRQIRGIILKVVLKHKEISQKALIDLVIQQRDSIIKTLDDFINGKEGRLKIEEQIRQNIIEMIKEGFLEENNDQIKINE